MTQRSRKQSKPSASRNARVAERSAARRVDVPSAKQASSKSATCVCGAALRAPSLDVHDEQRAVCVTCSKLPKFCACAPTTPSAKPSSSGDGAAASIVASWRGGATIAALVLETGKTRSQLRKLLTHGVGGVAAFKALRASGAGGSAAPFGGVERRRAARDASGGVVAPAPAVSDDGVRTLDGATLRWLPDASTHADAIARYAEYGERLKDEALPRMQRTALADVRQTLAKLAKLKRRPDAWTTRDVWRGVAVPTNEGAVPWRERIALLYVAPSGDEYVEAKPSERADLVITARRGESSALRLRSYATSSVAKRERRDARDVERGEQALKRTRAAKTAKRAARRSTKSKSKSK